MKLLFFLFLVVFSCPSAFGAKCEFIQVKSSDGPHLDCKVGVHVYKVFFPSDPKFAAKVIELGQSKYFIAAMTQFYEKNPEWTNIEISQRHFYFEGPDRAKSTADSFITALNQTIPLMNRRIDPSTIKVYVVQWTDKSSKTSKKPSNAP
jgi:hypothetical protein